ncbi:MAG: putative quinol monooxygenase [Myxococcota bacterium]
MNDNIYTIAILKAKPGQVDALIAVLNELATQTRREDGALEYGFIRDQQDPNVILSYERWKHADAESAHWQTPHLAAALARFEALLDGNPTVHKGSKII